MSFANAVNRNPYWDLVGSQFRDQNNYPDKLLEVVQSVIGFDFVVVKITDLKHPTEEVIYEMLTGEEVKPKVLEYNSVYIQDEVDKLKTDINSCILANYPTGYVDISKGDLEYQCVRFRLTEGKKWYEFFAIHKKDQYMILNFHTGKCVWSADLYRAFQNAFE